MKPIFIFSQPRAGSTLLQKILMTHEQISSFAEPWILLPLVYMQKNSGQVSLYSSETCKDALNDIIDKLPNKEDDYNKHINTFVSSIYQNLCPTPTQYFLDKTPRYYLIIDDIVKIFPDAKFIFLFRNPLSVYASVMTTWNKNSFRKIYKNKTDLFDSTSLLANAIEKYQEKSFVMHYEDLVTNPQAKLNELFNYLELDFDESITQNFFNQNLQGNMGDPTGSKKYKSISTQSLNNWGNVFNNQFRKYLLIKYINSIQENFFEQTIYNKKNLLEEIEQIKTKNNLKIVSDMISYLFGFIYNRSKLYFNFSKRFKWAKKYYLS